VFYLNPTCFGSYTPIFREFTKLWGTKVQDKKKEFFSIWKNKSDLFGKASGR
jgi:hypothetical protein